MNIIQKNQCKPFYRSLFSSFSLVKYGPVCSSSFKFYSLIVDVNARKWPSAWDIPLSTKHVQCTKNGIEETPLYFFSDSKRFGIKK